MKNEGTNFGRSEFERIKGDKSFRIHTDWFVQLLQDIGQPWARRWK